MLFFFFVFKFFWANFCKMGFRLLKICAPMSRESRLQVYLSLTLGIMLLEFVYGYVSNSLGLMADSFHMLLDGCSIIVGFLATYYARQEPNSSNPFGYVRYEVLCGFINGVLLLFVSVYILAEASVRLCFKADVEGDYLFSVSFIGLLLNIVGVCCFHDSVGHSHGSHCDHNLRGIYLHILADLLGSICVLISSVGIAYGYWYADPLFSLISACLIFFSAIPLVRETGRVLLLCSDEAQEQVRKLISEDIVRIRGMETLNSIEIWVHATPPNDFVICTAAVKLKNMCDYMKAKETLIRAVYRRVNDAYGANCRVIAHLES